MAFVPSKYWFTASLLLTLWGWEQPRRFSDSFVALRGEQPIPNGVKPPPPRLPAGVTVVDKGATAGGGTSATPAPIRLPGPDDAPPAQNTNEPEATQYGPAALSANLEFAVIGPARIAQTFEVSRTGMLTRVAWRLRVNHTQTAAGTLSLQAVDESGMPLGGALAQARVIFTPKEVTPLPWSEHLWDVPVLLKSGQAYAWVLQPDDGYSLNVSAGDDRTYRSGSGWVASGGEDVWSAANVDFTFQTYFASDATIAQPAASAPLNAAPNANTSDGGGASNSIQLEPRG